MPVIADIHYHLYEGSSEGKGKAVVLIHGAGGNYLSWPTQLRRLHGYRVYALDLPGHGKSTGAGRQSILAYSEAIVSWLAAVGVSKAILIGHSLGSAIALSMSLDFPDIPSGLVLIGTGARMKVNSALLEEYSSQTTFLNAIEKTVSWSFCDETPKRLVELVGQRMTETRQGVLYGDFLACAAFDAVDRLNQIKQPVLVLCGEQDKMTPCREAQFLADHLEKSVLKLIPRAGHMVMLEQPEAVAEEVRIFLPRIQ
jgi:pimeloyl-ACP methyl ester carboxylesterase